MGGDRRGRLIMLDGIETGYEERFDFPYRADPPSRSYVIATLPRTGSSFVSHLLWRTGCLGAPLEYLNFTLAGPPRFATDDPARQVELWRAMLHRRTSPNGIFGLKCFSLQMRELQQRNPALLMDVMSTLLLRGPETRVVRLRRRDSLAHAISYARASLSGVWRKEQERGDAPVVSYSQERVDAARRALDQQDADWDALLQELGIEPLELWYEDAVERPVEAVEQVAAFLGVILDPGAAIAVPQVERQQQRDAKRWTELYSTRPDR